MHGAPPPNGTTRSTRLSTKADLKDELCAILAADLSLRERAYRSAREAATHEEAKPENDKDTRALEQSYLARGEAKRLEESRAALAETEGTAPRDFGAGDPALLGALVTTEENGEETLVWLAPHGGGTRLAEGRVQVVTPKSPLGQALLGRRAGDDCEVRLAGRLRTLTIVSVA
jgi:transcription elongation GreA/GreB family factor